MINYEGETNVSSTSFCKYLFNDILTLPYIGINPKCYLYAENIISLEFGGNPTISIGDILYFNNDTIKRKGCSSNMNFFPSESSLL